MFSETTAREAVVFVHPDLWWNPGWREGMAESNPAILAVKKM
jgi:hypothetical protein